MLLKKLIEIRRADAELPPEIRAALVKSLFAPISSLVVGAISMLDDRHGRSRCASATTRNHGQLDRASSRSACCASSRRSSTAGTGLPIASAKRSSGSASTKTAPGHSRPARHAVLADLLADRRCRAADGGRHHATGYAAAISGRNAGAAFHRLGQLTSMHAADGGCAAVLYPDWVHKILGCRRSVVHVRHDGHHARHPRSHHSGADHDAQGSRARRALRGAGQPLRHRAQQHVARPVHARSGRIACRFGTGVSSICCTFETRRCASA